MSHVQRFQHIVVTGRPAIPGAGETLNALIAYLATLDVSVCVDKSIAHLITDQKVTTIPSHKLHTKADLIIVIGGDGSLLNAAHIAVEHDLPILGIHRGRLGFLTDIPPAELNRIADVLRGDYIEERRFLLEAELSHKDNLIAKDIALNDVVLFPGDSAHMIEFETLINNQFVHSQRADGMIVATPTGSTAYALSGGGPILHPRLDAIVLVPMFPHTLSSRPIVVCADSEIKILISENNDATPCVSFDGQNRIPLPPGGKIHLFKKTKQLRLIHPSDYTYYDTLRKKLQWERRAERN